MMSTGVHKHYSVEEWSEWSATHSDVLPFLAVSSGTSDADFAKVDAIMDVVDVPFICLDVANGYSEHVSTYGTLLMCTMIYRTFLYMFTFIL